MLSGKSIVMKIVIFHSFLDNIGGAEKLALTLARDLPADLYTTVADPEKIRRLGFSLPVHEIGWVPKNAPFRQQIALARFHALKLSKEYDHVLIAGDWAASGAHKNKNTVWYVHSPCREIWDLKDFTRNKLVAPLLRPAFDIWAYINQLLFRHYLKKIPTLLCNSFNTQSRIRKYLQRDARVIYPPVDTQRFQYRKTGDYWLSVNRLITHKQIPIQLEAFRQMPEEKLILVGSYEKSRHFLKHAAEIKKSLPANVELKSWVTEDALADLYADCRGFITTALDEDFGMTAIEAMAAGKPVIAPRSGGYCESIIDGKTGLLLEPMNSDTLCKAVRKLKPIAEYFREDCRSRAEIFSSKRFIQEIREALLESIA